MGVGVGPGETESSSRRVVDLGVGGPGDEDPAVPKQSCRAPYLSRAHTASGCEGAGGWVVEFGAGKRLLIPVEAAGDQDLAVIKQSCRMPLSSDRGHVAGGRECAGGWVIELGANVLSAPSGQDLAVGKQGRCVARPCRGHVAGGRERA